ncbi:transglutaminase domain-containing protein [Bacteroides helcogenes]|uniref:Transglutaminase domain-containing protein n=1 Tax=Bacteroides helcogenes (strain ATCC 35417 / DSM 20613 / JCM 6297 / CCUG 15421 / P 36-108) TaxID=693979 RepID=E6SW92_BACT6|nr:transglutaminase domain-containing protein [Bacteroides helcogenes]ADV43567.1 transglutaminase domain-containing protein [Bacteroides helcogenes P 36-108]MDY5239289.1 transglutaminase domain-containing protein [Bacteroides helcogenes]
MRRATQFLGIIGLTCLFVACGNSHFMTDAAYRQRVEQDFEQKKNLITQGEMFSIFDGELTTYEREALEFLYAYMPLADIADYSGEFHLMNVRASQQAEKEMPWGKNIPEDLYRHFVLPVRVNNEPLDSARVVFYKELKDRVKTLSIYDAILEVNHWCHEKAVYTPSDARTSSPLATVRTAYGRCGEESTLLVAALRSVGIPARQVYTPRWAHTDDNHAWVEAWADGKWHFLGACEPEPVLDLGWFNAPASRGMLMHTKVFGRYEGKEETMSVAPCYTEINVIDNYAPTAKAIVSVKDEQGRAVADARVEFKLYNYAEFYTVAAKQTDDSGTCSLTAGRGDMLVWASKDGSFGFAKLSFGKQQELTVVLDRKEGENFTEDINIVPPVENANLPEVTPEQRAENDRRLAQEDSVRNAYVATFMTEESARNFAERYKLDADVASGILVASRGNYKTICNFMARLRSDKSKKGGLDLLQQVSAKDLRDVRLEVLIDHMQSTVRTNAEYYRKYVRNPRVSNETLTPYKAFFGKVIPKEDVETYVADPGKLVTWVAEKIRVNKDCNLGGSPISPEGVWKARMADAHSRDIFFVSMARSMGIPARIDEVTGKVQLVTDEGAVDVNFGTSGQASARKGKLIAGYSPVKGLDDPKYYSHFTISKITPQGNLQLLSYDEGDIDMGGGATWSNLLKEGTALDAGNYVLVTGTRLASGAVLTEATSFSITPGQTTTVQLVMRANEDEVQVIGNFNSESHFTPLYDNGFTPDDLSAKSLLQACGRGYFVVGILGVNQEPTNHALRDIATFKADLEKWGRKIVLLFPDKAQSEKFVKEAFPGLPSTIIYGIDTDGIAAQIADAMKLKHKDTLPIFIIADTFNRVVFVSQGYTIGLGEQLMKVIHKI